MIGITGRMSAGEEKVIYVVFESRPVGTLRNVLYRIYIIKIKI
jgi:hypothetical protein